MTDASRQPTSLRWGLEAGLLAGLVVAGYFFVSDLVHLAPLSTPLALFRTFLGFGTVQADDGSVLGAAGVAAFLADLAAITVVHVLVFTLLGLAAVVTFRAAGWPLNLFTGALYGLSVCSAVFYISLALASHAAATVGIPGPVSVLVANTLAGAAIGGGVQLMRAPD